MKKLRIKEPCFAVIFVVLALLLTMVSSAVLRPVRLDYGSTWDQYLAEPEDSLDYLYLGSSFAYCAVNPSLIYDASGLTGYVLAGPEQTLSISYWYLKEALKTQSPQVLLIEGTSLHFDRYQGYTQVNVGYMPLSMNKIHAIFQASEPDLRAGLFFDLFFYHNRWKELSLDMINYAISPRHTDQLKGYTVVEGSAYAIPQEPSIRPSQDEAVYEENLAWLGKILALCEQQGIQPVVVFHPTFYPFAPEEYDRMRRDVADLDPNALFCDWTDCFDQIGLDPGLHLYDTLHLNRAGAALFAPWLGEFLTRELGVEPRPQTAENADAWAECAQYWLDYVPETDQAG